MTVPPPLSELDWLLFDWGDTLIADLPGQTGPMWQWPQLRVIRWAPELLHWVPGPVAGIISNCLIGGG